MRILDRPLAEIDLGFLEVLAANQTRESLTHEYRGALPPKGKEDQKLRYLETVASFANTEGGVIVFGFGEQRWEVHGLDPFNEDVDVQRLEKFALELDPPVAPLHVRALAGSAGHPVLLLGISRSLIAPHAVIYDDAGRVGYFRRNNRGKYAMDSRGLSQAFGERDRWRREVEELRIERAAFAKDRAEFDSQDTQRGMMLVHVLPLGRLSSRHDVSAARDDAHRIFQHLTTGERRMNLDGLWIREYSGGALKWLQCFRHGGSEFGLELREAVPVPRRPMDVSGDRIVFLMEHAIRAGVEWLEHVGVEPPFAVLVSFLDVDGTYLISRLGSSTESFDRPKVFLPPLYIGPGTADLKDVIHEASTLVWQATGRFRSPG